MEPTYVDYFRKGIGTAPRVCDVSCGNNHTVCVTTSGLVFSWGANDYRQLGTITRYCVFDNKLLGRKVTPKRLGPNMVPLKGNLFITRVACGPESTAITTAEGLVLVCGRLQGDGLQRHQGEFRLLTEILERNIYISKVSMGLTHMALLEDAHLTKVLALFSKYVLPSA